VRLIETARRFPPPWTVAEQAARYVVRDHGDEPGRRPAAKLLCKDEARRICSDKGKRVFDFGRLNPSKTSGRKCLH